MSVEKRKERAGGRKGDAETRTVYLAWRCLGTRAMLLLVTFTTPSIGRTQKGEKNAKRENAKRGHP